MAARIVAAVFGPMPLTAIRSSPEACWRRPRGPCQACDGRPGSLRLFLRLASQLGATLDVYLPSDQFGRQTGVLSSPPNGEGELLVRPDDLERVAPPLGPRRRHLGRAGA